MKAKMVLGVLLLAGMPLFGAVDAFIWFENVQGESTSSGHQGWIEVTSFSWGMSNASSMAHGSGGGEGKASFHDLSFTHKVDKASPALMNASLTGKHFANVRFDANGQHYQLQDVTITGNQQGSNGMETIKLNFARDAAHPAPPTPTPNATLNGGAVMLQSLKLVGQTQAIIVVCDVNGGQSVAALQRATQSRLPMPTLTIKANPKQPGLAGMSWTFSNAMITGNTMSASGCPQLTITFPRFDGPAGGY